MINLVDIFATIVELIDGVPPASPSLAPDSCSFRNILLESESTKGQRSTMVVSNAQGIFAIRQGPWKYIEGRLPANWRGSRQGTYQGQAVRQLYHLERDPAESHNMIEDYPMIASGLQKELDNIRQLLEKEQPITD